MEGERYLKTVFPPHILGGQLTNIVVFDYVEIS